ncbi:SEC-C metal-binding domain-containing protein [Lewinella sp. 4G2]|uniref:SEC-C metal-binding domain-containing protein n=1 Tax=Lewinella sp. 4G2 TaxID=1803372 RepID=UPI0007B493D8|nr:SEC-C metal-binding domain-containing protein [Lewinella sp. 4G2]OAV43966.1 hypothetical protein A3850_005420 [Lewinella sp. 4G2]
MTKEEILGVLDNYPTLRLRKYPSRIEGDFTIKDANGAALATYPISIRLYQQSFKKYFPVVYLLDDSLTRSADRHIYSSGRLCLATDFAQAIYYRDHKLGLQEFLELVLAPFLAAQTMIEEGLATNVFPKGERSHGTLGIVEEYCAFWNVSTPENALTYMEAYLLSGSKQRNIPCICGSGIKYKRCCLAKVNTINFIDRELIKNDSIKVRTWIDKGKPNENHNFNQ